MCNNPLSANNLQAIIHTVYAVVMKLGLGTWLVHSRDVDAPFRDLSIGICLLASAYWDAIATVRQYRKIVKEVAPAQRDDVVEELENQWKDVDSNAK
ncbi:hypothetical protein BV22DRAFT_1127580 [Leucogyrophana mollusca]|uniref:Uncharacterized protein n=1 Tax=Leucogyrophana mollusca TaxID=85980 RepID=A0ACB8BNB4_9AGAM|nr:hypothetical protein BV22DRAFT_1127580 [Leucogyrophana mollusca]